MGIPYTYVGEPLVYETANTERNRLVTRYTVHSHLPKYVISETPDLILNIHQKSRIASTHYFSYKKIVWVQIFYMIQVILIL